MSTKDLQAILTTMHAEKVARLEKIHSKWGDFSAYCWDDFEADRVARNLVSTEKPNIYGFRPTLFEALRAWVIAPEKPAHRKAALRYRISNLYFRKLRQVRKDFPYGGETELIIISRYKRIANFLNEIYYGIGGPEGIVGAPKPKVLQRRRINHAEFMSTVQHAMAIAHYVAEGNDGGLREPSLEGLSTLLSDKEFCSSISFKRQDPTTIKKHLKRYAPATAYIYAANSIQTAEHGTLLEAIVANHSLKALDPHIHEWVGRAAYVESKILRRFPTSSPYSQLRTTQGIAAIPFEIPAFTDEQIRMIRSQFEVRQRTKR